MKLNPYLNIKELDDNNFIIHNTVTNKYIKMGREELFLLKSYDCSNSDSGNLNDEWDPDVKEMAKQKFLELELLVNDDYQKPASSKIKKFSIRQLKDLNLSKIKLLEFDPTKLLDKIYPVINLILSPVAAVVYIALIVVAGVLVSKNSTEISAILTNFTENIKISEMIILYVLSLLALIIHEAAHAITCKKYHGEVKNVGIMLFYLQFSMFTDVSGIYMMNGKLKKILILGAGVISQWVLSSIAVIAFVIGLKTGYSMDFLIYFAIVNTALSIFNLIPFVKFDGYWILTVILGTYNLREYSFEYLVSKVLNKDVSNITKVKRIIYTFYGLLSIIFTILFWFIILNNLTTILHNWFNKECYYIVLVMMIMFLGMHFAKSIKNVYQGCKARSV